MTDIIDISVPIDERSVYWPGSVPSEFVWEEKIELGSHCNLSSWKASLHVGTHVDAPFHFISEGASIDEISMETFVGECLVVDLRELNASIMDESLARQYLGEKRLLIRTGLLGSGHDERYRSHEPLLTFKAAVMLLENGMALIGMDRYSPDSTEEHNCALHKVILSHYCVILEGLSLGAVDPGRYVLVAFPLNLKGREASPVRAVLLRTYDADKLSCRDQKA